MQKAQQIPNETSTYTTPSQRIYTRFHRRPQIYPTSFQTNKPNRIDTLDEENVNSLISDIYKQKKFRGILDPSSPNNKNIFIDTDSEVQKTDKISEELQNTHDKKSTQLLIAKTESQFPETYNAQNDGPPEITETTISVSFMMLNWMPMPSNEPSSVSIIVLLSSAVE